MTSDEKRAQRKERYRNYKRAWDDRRKQARAVTTEGESVTFTTDKGFGGCRDCRTCEKYGCRHNRRSA